MLQDFIARLPRKINIQDDHGRTECVAEPVGPVENLDCLLAIAGDVERDWKLCRGDGFFDQEDVSLVILNDKDLINDCAVPLFRRGA